jgi:hypothetical protein
MHILDYLIVYCYVFSLFIDFCLGLIMYILFPRSVTLIFVFVCFCIYLLNVISYCIIDLFVSTCVLR